MVVSKPAGAARGKRLGARAVSNAVNRPTALIAEDEPILRDQLVQKLGRLWPELELLAAVGDGEAALEAAEARMPDLLFLDIQMPEVTGLDVARAIAGQAHVVFVTAYDRYALEAFDAGAVDYLLKPVTDERLQVAITRLKSRIGTPAPDLGEIALRVAAQLRGVMPTRLQWIKAGVGQTVRLISVDEVAFFQSDEKYTRVVTAEGESLVRLPIRELLEGLDPDSFWQIHRSTVVNARHIASVTRDDRGLARVHLKGLAETLSVSRAFTHRFRQM